MSVIRTPWQHTVVLGLALLLGACGGGGGADATFDQPPNNNDPGGGAPIADLTGEWSITETGISNCEGEATYADTYSVDVRQNGDALTVTTDAGTFTGTISGNQVTWSGSYPEDGGTVTIVSLTLTVADDGSRLSGSASWTWTDGASSCSGTAQAINGARISSAGAVPAAPTDLTASEQSASAIRLIWSSSGETLTGFKIERSLSEDSGFMQIAVLGRDSTSHVDESLDESTTYYYRLRAYEGTRDSGYSNVASATTSAAPLGVPAAPTDLRAEDATSNSIVLYWLDNSNGTSFQIERSSSARAGFSLIASTPAAATSYTDNGLNSATTYFYRVRAVNSVGSSGYSNVVSGTTLAAVNAPAAPTHLSSRALTGNAVELTWVDNSQDETGFKVERSNFEQSGFTQIQIVQRDTRHFTDTELNPRTTYFYRVRATNADATTPLDSSYSNTSRATTSAQASLAPTIDTTMMSSTASPDLANTAVGNKENAVGCNWIYSFVTQTQDFVCAISALYFDIQSVAGRTIHSAPLLLYPHPNLLPADLNSTLELKAIASPWSSQTMTWNNWRETGQVWLNPIVRRSPPATAAAPIEFDITDIMRNWAGGVRINRGLLLANSAADYLFPTATLLRAVGFESMEFNTDMARKPQLVIDYQ